MIRVTTILYFQRNFVIFFNRFFLQCLLVIFTRNQMWNKVFYTFEFHKKQYIFLYIITPLWVSFLMTLFDGMYASSIFFLLSDENVEIMNIIHMHNTYCHRIVQSVVLKCEIPHRLVWKRIWLPKSKTLLFLRLFTMHGIAICWANIRIGEMRKCSKYTYL